MTCVAVSHGGDLLASGEMGDAADVIVWEFGRKTPRFRFQEHDYRVECLAFSHDDRLLCSMGVVDPYV